MLATNYGLAEKTIKNMRAMVNKLLEFISQGKYWVTTLFLDHCQELLEMQASHQIFQLNQLFKRKMSFPLQV